MMSSLQLLPFQCTLRLAAPPIRPAAPPVIFPVSRRIFTVGGGALLPFLAAPPPIAASEPLTSDEITQRAFLDISIDGEPAGRIIIGLYGAAVPGGAARFAALISGELGSTYRRKPFTKILPGYIQHGGVPGGAASDDLVKEWEVTAERRRRRGTESTAAAVGILVRDPAIPPPKTKIVAKKGKLVVEEEEVGVRPNGTEFVIVVKESPELDERALVVGRVVEGMEVAERIAGLETVKENSSSPYFRVAKLIGDKRAVVAARGFNRPYSKIIVTNCGLLH